MSLFQVQGAQTQISELPPQSADSIGSSLSPVESPMTNLPSPYDTTTLYSNMGLTAQGLESLIGKILLL